MADQERKHGHRIVDSVRKEERKNILLEKDSTDQARYRIIYGFWLFEKERKKRLVEKACSV